MPEPRLHLDADISMRMLQTALVARGHDVTRTPNEWMPLDATDETQLLRSTAQGRLIATFNIVDFVALAAQYPEHAGIVLATQRSWTLSSLIEVLDSMLSTTTATEWPGQVRWLNEWR